MSFHHPVMDDPDFPVVRDLAKATAATNPEIMRAIDREGLDNYVVMLFLDGRVEDGDEDDEIVVVFPQEISTDKIKS